MSINLISLLLSTTLCINPIISITSKVNTSTEFNLTEEHSKEFNWYYQLDKNTRTISPPKECTFLNKHKVAFVGDSSKKEIFLTFDEGYEKGYSGKILDILKSNDVPAAFFVTRPYIEDNPDLIKRMETEGHLVCNHSSHHPSMATITDKSKFENELKEVEEEYTRVTGKEMPKFFRPPMGKFSDLSLKYTDELGYTSVFWSFAYKDWLIDNQPSKEEGMKKILEKAHNGEIMLLHAVSATNTSILDQVLKELKANGYTFKPLTELNKE